MSDAHARACFGRVRDDHPVAWLEEKGHGRKETRTATVISAKGLAERHDFTGLKVFGRIEATRGINGTVTSEIPPEQEIASVTADGACDTRKCHDAIAERGAAAVIPPRKNAKPWKADSAGAAASNEALRASRRLGRAIRRRWSGYPRRSRAERPSCTASSCWGSV